MLSLIVPRRLVPTLILAVLALPASAQAAWFPADQVDGPSADIVSVGGIDMAREGMGAIVYLKRDGAVPHVFVARLFNGAWEPPARVDQGVIPPASQPVIAASGTDRLAVAWVSNGSLFTAVRPQGAPGFTPARQLAQGNISNPSIDMSINGATYVSFTQDGNVQVARADRDRQEFTILPAPVDNDPGRSAGTGTDNRSRIVVSADGSALVLWGENGADGRSHVYGRRLFEYRLSTRIEDLTLSEFEGSTATDADRPEVDIEDDSSFAQVAFRQQTARGPRLVGRRLVGSEFDPPFPLDSGANASRGEIAITGRGEGVTAAELTSNEVFGASLWNNRLERMQRWDSGPNGISSRPIPLVGENENGALTWFAGSSAADATVRARFFSEVQFLKLEPEVTISNPAFGGIDVDAGFDGASSRVSDHIVTFVQGAGTDRRLVAAVYDDPPARPLGQNTTNKRKLERFKWAPARDLWGPLVYRVFFDNVQIAETGATELPVTPKMVRDGRHRWYVVATDRRGQQTAGPPRTLNIDNTPPLLRASIGRRRRTVNVRIRSAGDARGTAPSGLSRIIVDFGNGRRVSIKSGTRYTYPRGGSYTVTVSAFDRAGNEAAVTRSFRIG